MSINQLYSLTWGQFGTSLVSAVQLLRCHGDLVDVTLAAGGKTFPAHKVVLCAASPLLLDLLKSTPCKHPIVMLAGVTATDLEALLEFVYRGEVSIDPNQLPSLLQAAHCLNIQGLAPATTVLSDSIVQHQTMQLHNEKTVIDATKTNSINQPSNDSQDGNASDQLIVTGDDVNISSKRRKKLKRKNSNSCTSGNSQGAGGKPAKYYIQSENTDSVVSNRSNDSTENTNDNGEYAVTVIERGDGYKYTTAVPRKNEEIQCQSTGNSPLWTTQHIHLINASTSTAESSSSPIPPAPPPSAMTKTKAASDQPGTCPLCGAMLRQARNLRRHLLTSCKYRMVSDIPAVVGSIITTSGSSNSKSNNSQQDSNSSSSGAGNSHHYQHTHHIHSVQLHDMGRLDPIKDPLTLTTIACNISGTTSGSSNSVE